MTSERLLAACCLLPFVTACGIGERAITVENCGEPIEISDCKWKGQLFTCLVENKSDDIYRGTPVWKYDLQGNSLGYAPYKYAVGLKPGKKVREKLPVTKYNQDTTAKVIFCNRQPQ